MTIRLLFAFVLAVMFDATSGLAVYHAASRLDGRGAIPFGYMLAMFLALLPDIGVALNLARDILAMFLAALFPHLDVVVKKLRSGGVTGEHKTSFTHMPLVFGLLTFLFLREFSSFWAWVAIGCLVMHYLHDLFETGPGIPVFAPFAGQRYLLCKWRAGRFHWIYPLTPQELDKWLNTTLEWWLEAEYCYITSNSLLGPVALAATLLMMWLW